MAKVTKSRNTSWTAFHRAVSDPSVKMQNLHWRPQGDFCGFNKFFPLFQVSECSVVRCSAGEFSASRASVTSREVQFVGQMERMAVQGEQLLRSLGLWEGYGANEWSLAKVIKTSRIRDRSKNRYNFKRPEVSGHLVLVGCS